MTKMKFGGGKRSFQATKGQIVKRCRRDISKSESARNRLAFGLRGNVDASTDHIIIDVW